MPKTKASGSLESSGAVRLTCPACKSEISSDGRTLYGRSKYLDELIETYGDVPKLEKLIEVLEEKLHSAKLEAEKRKAVAVAVQTKSEGDKDAKGKVVV